MTINKEDGYQCLSIWADRRCNLAHGHAGAHEAYSSNNGPGWSASWTDADIGPQATPAIDIAVVVTDIRALLTGITGELTESNRLLTDIRSDLGEFLTRTGETEAERAKAAQDRISAMEKMVRERLGLPYHDRPAQCPYCDVMTGRRCHLQAGHDGPHHTY